MILAPLEKEHFFNSLKKCVKFGTDLVVFVLNSLTTFCYVHYNVLPSGQVLPNFNPTSTECQIARR